MIMYKEEKLHLTFKFQDELASVRVMEGKNFFFLMSMSRVRQAIKMEHHDATDNSGNHEMLPALSLLTCIVKP